MISKRKRNWPGNKIYLVPIKTALLQRADFNFCLITDFLVLNDINLIEKELYFKPWIGQKWTNLFFKQKIKRIIFWSSLLFLLVFILPLSTQFLGQLQLAIKELIINNLGLLSLNFIHQHSDRHVSRIRIHSHQLDKLSETFFISFNKISNYPTWLARTHHPPSRTQFRSHPISHPQFSWQSVTLSNDQCKRPQSPSVVLRLRFH